MGEKGTNSDEEIKKIAKMEGKASGRERFRDETEEMRKW